MRVRSAVRDLVEGVRLYFLLTLTASCLLCGPLSGQIDDPQPHAETLKFSDDFSSGLAAWQPYEGSWTIENGRLKGFYTHTCGSPGCAQGDLILKDAYQPQKSDWRIEVEFSYVNYPGGTYNSSLAMLVLWYGASQKETVYAGFGGDAWNGAARTEIGWSRQSGLPWTQKASGTAQKSWDPKAWNKLGLQKTGTQYSLIFNGQSLHTFTATFAGTPKVGLHIYGVCLLDNFKLYESDSAAASVPYAGRNWTPFDYDTRPRTYTEISPGLITVSGDRVSFKTGNEYIFRGIKTQETFPENDTAIEAEMWFDTSKYNSQSHVFAVTTPFGAIGFYNYGSYWWAVNLKSDGSQDAGTRLTFPASSPGTHHTALIQYIKSSQQMIVSLKTGTGTYQEVFRKATKWGLKPPDLHYGETGTFQRIVLETSDPTGTVNYRLLRLTQGQSCTYTLSPASTSPSIPAAGKNGVTFQVQAPAGCPWTATTTDPWISLASGASGSGNGTVTLNVAANSGAARTGKVMAGGQTFTVSQDAGGAVPCNVRVTGAPSTGAPGQSLSLTITGKNCGLDSPEGGINVSFPDLGKPGDRSNVAGTSTGWSVVSCDPGQTNCLTQKSGSKLATTQYVALEAWGSWPANTEKSFTVTFQPKVAGTFRIQYRAYLKAGSVYIGDPATGSIDQQGWEILSHPVSVSCSITLAPNSLAPWQKGSYGQLQLTASGGSAPVSFAIVSGILPAGLTMTASGLISGTPTASGTSSFTVKGTDAKGCVGTQALTLEVQTKPCTVVCSASAAPTASVGELVRFQSSLIPSNCAPPITYEWDFGDGSALGDQAAPGHVYKPARTYKWKLTVKADGKPWVCSASTGEIEVKPTDDRIRLRVRKLDTRTNSTSAYPPQSVRLGMDPLNPAESKTLTWPANQESLTWDLSLWPPLDWLSPGSTVPVLAYSFAGGSSVEWGSGAWPGLDLLFYPRSQKAETGETFTFEHLIVPDEKAERGYPYFSMIRHPAAGDPDGNKDAIVFVHGISGAQGYWNRGDGLPEALSAKGYEAWEVSYPPFDSIRKSGYLVWAALKRIHELRGSPAKKLNVVTHSMGGLVARTILEGYTEKPGAGGTFGPDTSMLGKTVFLTPPHHGSHTTNAMRHESGSMACEFFASLIQDARGGDPASRDLNLGSPMLWELNSRTRLTTLLQSWGTSLLTLGGSGARFNGTCFENPQSEGSFGDEVVSGASAILDQKIDDASGSVTLSGFFFSELPAYHTRVKDQSPSDATVSDAAMRIDEFIKIGPKQGGSRQQTQGMPLLSITGLDSRISDLQLGGSRLHERVVAGESTLNRNFYFWNNEERADLPSGLSPRLYYYCYGEVDPRDTGTTVAIPEGMTLMKTITWDSRWGCGSGSGQKATADPTADSHVVEFTAVSLGGARAAELTMTDPAGKVVSATRNDLASSGLYRTDDLNADGVKDTAVASLAASPGRYQITWSSATGSSPTDGFLLRAKVDHRVTEILPETVLYQRPTGAITFDVSFDPPAAVTDLTVTKGAGDGQVEITWTDPPVGGPFAYDLRYSVSSISDEAAFSSAAGIGLPDFVPGTSRRFVLQLPASATPYFFRLKTSGRTGALSAMSNEASATSGPGGSGLFADSTPPSTPDVRYSGGTPTPGSLAFTWRSLDGDSGVSGYRYCLGTAPNRPDVIPWTDGGSAESATLTSPYIAGGRTYVLSVVARNGARLESAPGFSSAVFIPDSCANDSFEPDNDFGQAKVLLPGQPQNRNLCGDPDFVRFAAKAGTSYEITFSGLDALAQPAVTLFDGLTRAEVSGVNVLGNGVSWRSSYDGDFFVRVSSRDQAYGRYRSYALRLEAATSPVLLSGGGIAVDVLWRSQYSGQGGRAMAIPQGDRFAYFYFSDPSNPEVFVKVLDFGADKPYLLFYAGLTDFEYTVTFTNLKTGKSVQYQKPPGSFSGGATNNDLPHASFRTLLWSKDGLEVEEIGTRASAVGGTSSKLGTSPSVPKADASEMVLSRGAVAVSVNWRSQYSGQSGVAFALPQKDEFGFFYFTDRSNPEVFVKVLDFGADRPYLVFYAGLTDFEYEVTFRNVHTGQKVTFKKPAGTFIGGADNASLNHAP
ncbi:MAG: PKD domain-containing protein [Thermoanaerobaculia bacterium]|nr:PKD domain-containing protein [Thermoanaerobaculia bacterium]